MASTFGMKKKEGSDRESGIDQEIHSHGVGLRHEFKEGSDRESGIDQEIQSPGIMKGLLHDAKNLCLCGTDP